ncbi:hypothetical protein SeMB42_g07437 [Synchytrium endobioticum]|uniref:Uncharacterized protein n=1 Tax=Synchytrium endobioticum TaxID=286115 RepID=A0A507C2T0_9FUNG|nr:hypothetical protein SeMB42_g07437 [Synchytrium endobioticum]TPX39946.1 hypothetical protein SeLEV6574_g06908 [Synchytrium endobioticum]
MPRRSSYDDEWDSWEPNTAISYSYSPTPPASLPSTPPLTPSSFASSTSSTLFDDDQIDVVDPVHNANNTSIPSTQTPSPLAACLGPYMPKVPNVSSASKYVPDVSKYIPSLPSSYLPPMPTMPYIPSIRLPSALLPSHMPSLSNVVPTQVTNRIASTIKGLGIYYRSGARGRRDSDASLGDAAAVNDVDGFDHATIRKENVGCVTRRMRGATDTSKDD